MSITCAHLKTFFLVSMVHEICDSMKLCLVQSGMHGAQPPLLSVQYHFLPLHV